MERRKSTETILQVQEKIKKLFKRHLFRMLTELLKFKIQAKNEAQ